VRWSDAALGPIQSNLACGTGRCAFPVGCQDFACDLMNKLRQNIASQPQPPPTTQTLTMADSTASTTGAASAESPAQEKARLRRERRAAKIAAGGADRLQAISSLQGGSHRDFEKDVPGALTAHVAVGYASASAQCCPMTCPLVLPNLRNQQV
jgi:hypothetical protein